MDRDWAKDLKVGDEVIYEPRGGTRLIAKVEKINKTTIKVNGSLFYFNGKQRGDVYFPTRISPCTKEAKEEVIDEIERDKLIRILTNTVWRRYSTDKLWRVNEILKEEQK